MAWLELKIDTTSEAVDWVCTLLSTTAYTDGIQVVEYGKSGNQLSDPGLSQPDPAAVNWDFTLCFYLPYDHQVRACIDTIEQQLSGLYRTGQTSDLHITVVDEKLSLSDQPVASVFRIGQRFVMRSPDSDYCPKPHEIPLTLTPSLTFGSGFHLTTRLILQLLERRLVPGTKGLDLGSGSGILSVAMARLGATVLALDNDPIAVKATQNAIQLNHVGHQVTVMEGSLGYGSDLGHWMGGTTHSVVPVVEPQANFDLIVANVMARIQVALAQDYRKAICATGTHPGQLLISGFTQDYEPDVNAALSAAGFEQVDCEREEGWVALAYHLNPRLNSNL